MAARLVRRDSIFRIYSMTKPITGVAMTMLYEEGRWRLNDPVSRYLPGGAAGTWFWIDPATDLTFVGMIQHRGTAVRDVQGISRNLAYQAIVD